MGLIFPLKSSNIIAFITAHGRAVAPRFTRGEIRIFLEAFKNMPQYEQEQQPWQPRLISSRPAWIQQVQEAAITAQESLDSLTVDLDEWLEQRVVDRVLSDLKILLGDYELFALAVRRQFDPELNAFVQEAAYASGGHAIYLVPDEISDRFDVLDPFPAIALLAEHPDKWPGVLFWSRRGVATFCSLNEARIVHGQLLEIFRNPSSYLGSKVDQILNAHQSASSSKRLLQLSDLHFGTEAALENEAFLSAHLASVLPEVDRVVITGDLMQNPARHDALAFRNFRASLIRAGKDPIVIPGNHDQKWMGIVGSSLQKDANIEWSKVTVDDDLGCVFLCFDSSRDADLARGKVTAAQMMEVATELETQCVRSPQIRGYLTIALVHHHPFSFETSAETWIQRTLKRVGLSDEYFLRMEDADKWLTWCARRGARLILHGHKHVPRHVTHYVPSGDPITLSGLDITAVGCGTSLGAEGGKLSYNVITWDERSRQWAVSFFSDPGDGGGFARQYVVARKE